MSLDLEPILERHIKKHLREYSTRLREIDGSWRKENAALKRQVSSLEEAIKSMQKNQSSVPTRGSAGSAGHKPPSFSADQLRKHRSKLGLSAHDYALLAGVSALSVYKWESGKTRPRQAQILLLAAVQGLSKLDAVEKLAKLKGK